jgi:hypothetical protein
VTIGGAPAECAVIAPTSIVAVAAHTTPIEPNAVKADPSRT